MINSWAAQSTPQQLIGQPQLTLQGNHKYPVKLQYYEGDGDAQVKLMWQPPNTGSAIAIPSPNLSPPAADLNRPATSNDLYYLHGDHLGSVSVVTNEDARVVGTQEFDPWGLVRNPPGPPINATTLNYTGQQLDGTNLLYYHSRYYDPFLSRFVSPDSIVPGVESGKGGAAASVGAYQNHKLTVDFHEPGFAGELQGENALVLEKGFWFQLSGEDRKEVNDPWGPVNPQALNRYSYVLNNPLRYTDPSGHVIRYTHKRASEVMTFLRDEILPELQNIWNKVNVTLTVGALLGMLTAGVGGVFVGGTVGAVVGVSGTVAVDASALATAFADPTNVNASIAFVHWMIDQLDDFENCDECMYIEFWIDYRHELRAHIQGQRDYRHWALNQRLYEALVPIFGW